jgi:serine/threonine protein kinase
VTCDASEVALSERIGAGAFATVYSAAWRGSQVAVKVWQPLDMHQQVAIRVDGSCVSLNTAPGGTVGAAAEVDVSFMREVALLSSLRHPNILAIYALVKAPPMLVMELAPAGSLKDLLARTQLENLGWRRRLGIAIGVACGVEHLHAQSPPICHFDLKCGNVVLDMALVPKARAACAPRRA